MRKTARELQTGDWVQDRDPWRIRKIEDRGEHTLLVSTSGTVVVPADREYEVRRGCRCTVRGIAACLFAAPDDDTLCVMCRKYHGDQQETTDQ